MWHKQVVAIFMSIEMHFNAGETNPLILLAVPVNGSSNDRSKSN